MPLLISLSPAPPGNFRVDAQTAEKVNWREELPRMSGCGQVPARLPDLEEPFGDWQCVICQVRLQSLLSSRLSNSPWPPPLRLMFLQMPGKNKCPLPLRPLSKRAPSKRCLLPCASQGCLIKIMPSPTGLGSLRLLVALKANFWIFHLLSLISQIMFH